ncbi:hypothetical protein [Cupriavidus plantarum]|uniref:hypothetical protein n=1 Tax=Cupriavidus plantarum TaxID=942865 RepID=UPI00339D6EB0
MIAILLGLLFEKQNIAFLSGLEGERGWRIVAAQLKKVRGRLLAGYRRVSLPCWAAIANQPG